MKKLSIVLILLISAIVANCASLTSASQSISNAISSVVSSPSASGWVGDFQARNLQYQKDVQAIIQIQTEDQSFHEEKLQRALAKAAGKHGILNWERHIDTYYGIGRGLKASHASSDEVQSILKSIQNSTLQNELEKGYQSI